MEGLGYNILKVMVGGFTEEPLLDGFEGRRNIHTGGKIQAKLPKQICACHLSKPQRGQCGRSRMRKQEGWIGMESERHGMPC